MESPKRLIIRLSSLGDVILATSALEVARSRGERWDWVVSREYAPLLEGHPAVGTVWKFDRHEGLSGWVRLAKLLWREEYSDVFDLHSTLRSHLLKWLFWFWGHGLEKDRPNSSRRPLWKVMSKRRASLYGYFLFKNLWPSAWRPDRIVERSSRVCGGRGSERPDLRHLISPGNLESDAGFPTELHNEKYVCVMPGSRWDGKKWPVERYVEVLANIPMLGVVMGGRTDQESFRLLELLRERGIRAVSCVGNTDLRGAAQVLAHSQAYLGNDTGLGHLAEAVGVPAVVVFGPTKEDMGFGPWKQDSRALGSSLWCRPCGKDGRSCFRVSQKFKCIRDLKAQSVIEALQKTARSAVERESQHHSPHSMVPLRGSTDPLS